jgi:hypothetical protein
LAVVRRHALGVVAREEQTLPKARLSVQKRERESRKHERRLRKAERAAAKLEQPAETPDAQVAAQPPAGAPTPAAADLSRRSSADSPAGSAGQPAPTIPGGQLGKPA